MAVKPAPGNEQAVAVAEAPKAEVSKEGSSKRKARPRPKLVAWGERDEDGELKVKLTKKPEDWSHKTHEPLRRKDFETAADYIGFRAQLFEERAAQLRKMEAEERSGVGKETKAKRKKLLSLREKMEALRAELEAMGVNADETVAVK